jgi:hypothetical protein
MSWKPAFQVENPDLEAIREIARQLTVDTKHFHEVAMADPFQAESYVQDVGRRLLLLVGYPEGTMIYDSSE